MSGLPILPAGMTNEEFYREQAEYWRGIAKDSRAETIEECARIFDVEPAGLWTGDVAAFDVRALQDKPHDDCGDPGCCPDNPSRALKEIDMSEGIRSIWAAVDMWRDRALEAESKIATARAEAIEECAQAVDNYYDLLVRPDLSDKIRALKDKS